MNILYVATLLSVVCHVFASEISSETSLVPMEVDSVEDSYEVRGFKKNIVNKAVGLASELFSRGSEEQKKHCINYLFSLGWERFADLVNEAGNFKDWPLQILLLHAEQEHVDKVFQRVMPSDDLLLTIANNADLVCKPDKFIYILKGMTSKTAQKAAFDFNSNVFMFSEPSECIISLVSTLEGEEFLDQEVMHYAIQKAFSHAINHPTDKNVSYIKAHHGHPAILVQNYSRALYCSYKSRDPTNVLFYWLLVRADREDLEAVKINKHSFVRYHKEFRDAVNHALSSLDPKALNRRQRRSRERIAAIDDALEYQVPTVLLDMIGEYDI